MNLSGATRHAAKTIAAAMIVATVNAAGMPAASCSLDDIRVKSFRAKFVNECERSECVVMKGVAVLTNRCHESVGVLIRVTAYDSHGAPVSTANRWPASIENIPPGDYTFSLDQWLDYDPEMKTFDLTPIEIHRW